MSARVPSSKPANRYRELFDQLDPARLPRHVAIIMDGNGRWARERGHHRLWGHQNGYKVVRQIVRDAPDLGISVLTLYVFSAENWKRPRHETEGLMKLIERAARTELPELHDSGVRMRFCGRRSDLPPSLQVQMAHDEAVTAGNQRLTLNLCINYGGRTEIVDAARLLAEKAVRGDIAPSEITPELFAQHLTTNGQPDPDLLIRTAGEMRVSNYLLYQIAYAEIWVTPTLWPDFTTKHLLEAIVDYQGRVRKFGGVLPTK
jgi:undecaprenyl diphosphate synthase